MSRDLQIIRVDPETRIVEMEFPNPPRFVEGIFFLVQAIVLELYQNPGTQLLDLEAGAGFERFLGTAPRDDTDLLLIRMDISTVIAQVADRIRRRQARETLTGEERLRELRVEKIAFDRPAATWVVILRVVNEVNQSSRIDVGKVVFAEPGIRSRGA